MQVNYIQQINLFFEFARRNRLTPYDRILWLGLLHCANRMAMSAANREWVEDFFQVSNNELMDWAGLEERAIRNSRNRLKQIGLLDFVKGDGKRSDPLYKINYLTVVGYKIIPIIGCRQDTTGNKNAADGASGGVGGCVGDSVGERVSEHDSTSGKFVPGGVCDNRVSSNSIIKTKTKEKEKEKEEIKAKGEENARGAFAGGFSADCGGLVDLNADYGETAGLIAFPWEDGVVSR